MAGTFGFIERTGVRTAVALAWMIFTLLAVASAADASRPGRSGAVA